MEPKELPLMTMENPLTEDKISKIVSNMKKKQDCRTSQSIRRNGKTSPKIVN